MVGHFPIKFRAFCVTFTLFIIIAFVASKDGSTVRSNIRPQTNDGFLRLHLHTKNEFRFAVYCAMFCVY